MGFKWYQWDRMGGVREDEISLDEIKARGERLLIVLSAPLLLLAFFFPKILLPWTLVLYAGLFMARPLFHWEHLFRPDQERVERLDPVGDVFLREATDDKVFDLTDTIISYLLVGLHFVVDAPSILVRIGLTHRLRSLGWMSNVITDTLGAVWPFLILALAFGYAAHGWTGSAKFLGIVVGLDGIGEVHRLFARVSMGQHKGRMVLALAGKLVRLRSVLLAGLVVVIAFAVIYYALGQENGKAFNNQPGILDSIYFSVITAATVGYGDFSPSTPPAKIVCMMEVLFGFLFIVLVISTVLSVWQKQHMSDTPDITEEPKSKETWAAEMIPWV